MPLSCCNDYVRGIYGYKCKQIGEAIHKYVAAYDFKQEQLYVIVQTGIAYYICMSALLNVYKVCGSTNNAHLNSAEDTKHIYQAVCFKYLNHLYLKALLFFCCEEQSSWLAKIARA